MYHRTATYANHRTEAESITTRPAGQPAVPTNISDLIEQIKTELPGLLKREGIPGISIALVNRDSTLWEAGFGITDRIRKAPATPATLFSMQSCSKTFTATAILLAVQEGLVELEQPIVEYRPGLFFTSTGEAVDFTGVTPLIFGVPVRKIGLLEELRCWSILAGGKIREGMLKLRLMRK